MTKSYYFIILSLIALAKAIFLGFYIAYGPVGLGPDEAQYWTWSQLLSIGYYSKPPGIAWLIRLGTEIFGNSELGVRSGSILLGFISTLAIYSLSISAGLKERVAFFAGLMMVVTPLGLLGSLLAITDNGLFLFWTLAMFPLVKAIKNEKTPNYWFLGLAIAGGSLFKWPIYYVWLIVAALIPFYRTWWNKQLFCGIVISLLGLIPSLVWNVDHDWATFRHVGSTIQGGAIPVARAKGNPGAFLGEQFLLLSPLLFGMLLVALTTLWKKGQEITKPMKYCGWVFVTFLGAYTFLSFFQKVQGNWVDFIYPTGIVFLAWYWAEVKAANINWLKSGIIIGLLFSLLILWLPSIDLPYRLNPFKSNLGWRTLSAELLNKGYNPTEHFLVGDKYQTSSILSFYSPSQKRAYFLNLNGGRKNQFSFWPSLAEEQTGKSGFFVVFRDGSGNDGEKFINKISPYFEKVVFLGEKPLITHKGKPVKVALFFQCINYKGELPPQPDLY